MSAMLDLYQFCTQYYGFYAPKQNILFQKYKTMIFPNNIAAKKL